MEKKKIIFDKYEYGITMNALNYFRNYLLEHDKPTEDVDDLMCKLVKVQFKSLKRAGYESR